MDDSVHDGIRNDTTAEAGMPFARFVLRTKDGRPLIVTSFEDLQEIFVLLFRRDIEEPFIYDEEAITAVAVFPTVFSTNAFCFGFLTAAGMIAVM